MARAKYGRLYHIIHHAEEVRDEAKENLGNLIGIQGDKRTVALYAAAAERVQGMDTDEKIQAILQGFEFKQIEDYLVNRASSVVAYDVLLPEQPKTDDILACLLHQILFLLACLLEGIPFPGEP